MLLVIVISFKNVDHNILTIGPSKYICCVNINFRVSVHSTPERIPWTFAARCAVLMLSDSSRVRV